MIQKPRMTREGPDLDVVANPKRSLDRRVTQDPRGMGVDRKVLLDPNRTVIDSQLAGILRRWMNSSWFFDHSFNGTEFSISAEAIVASSIFVNKHGDIYDQGLAFGGVNGTAVKNIHGDGHWNQRYMCRSWDFLARPSKEVTPLKPEDHHLVQKAIAGA